MFHGNRKSIVLIAVFCSAFQSTAHAIDAVFIPGSTPFISNTGGTIEVQGVDGRFDLPTRIQGPNQSLPASDQTSGATATDSILYTLLNPPISGSSIITESDTHTGAYLGKITLPSRFTDIAYTNGQLYGAQIVAGPSNTKSLQIASIAANGTVQPILTQNLASSTTNWRLSGEVDGDNLLVAPSSIFNNTPAAETFVPSTPSIPPSTFNLSNVLGNISDTVIHADGTAATVISGGQQVDYSYPGATPIGSRASDTYYGSGRSNGIISDEFNYNYPSSQPAAILLDSSYSTFLGTHDGLYRTPQTISGTDAITIQNGVAPDGATVSNLAANDVLYQAFGAPLPFVIQETDAPPGAFTARQIGQANISVNLTTATHGIYAIGVNSNVTADYTTASTTQTGRPINVVPNGESEFAYDPSSANLVGNGDGSLSGFGWETFDTRENVVENAFVFGGVLGLGLFPESGDPQLLSQILSEPTSNGPMLLSFSYDITTGLDPADLVVSLDGVEITDLSVTSTTPTTFQAVINNPSLENLTDATLSFRGTDAGTIGASFVNLGSVSLTAVPEPASASLVGLVAMAIFTRKRRWRK